MSEEILLEPPVAGSEADTLIGSLERQRRTFAWKCADLDAAGLNTRLAPSTITLGGLLKHLALVEADYFTLRLLGEDPGAPWNTVDWEAEPGWEWRSAADDSPEELYALWGRPSPAPGPMSARHSPRAASTGSPTTRAGTGTRPACGASSRT